MKLVSSHWFMLNMHNIIVNVIFFPVKKQRAEFPIALRQGFLLKPHTFRTLLYIFNKDCRSNTRARVIAAEVSSYQSTLGRAGNGSEARGQVFLATNYCFLHLEQ